jgi:AAA domain
MMSVVTQPQTNTLWKPASAVADAQGVNIALFGFPGSGKTDLAASAQYSEHGKDVLIIDADGTAPRSLSDRTDVQIYPARNWEHIERIDAVLKSGRHSFRTFSWDTLTSIYEFALKVTQASGAGTQQASQPEYGKANEMVGKLIGDWCAIAREKGINVIFCVHAKEVYDEQSKVTYIRMSLTPGATDKVYQKVDTIGYLSESRLPKDNTRKLLLKSNQRVIAKHHQPRTGEQLPAEIPNPTMDILFKHAKRLAKEAAAAPVAEAS